MIGQSGAGRLVTPPPGTPDLAAMAIRGSDLPGARVTRQGYSTPAKSFVASYQRTLDLPPLRADAADRRPKRGEPRAIIGHRATVRLPDSAGRRSVRSEEACSVVRFDLWHSPNSRWHLEGQGESGPGEGYEATVTIRTKFDEIRTLLVFVQVDRVVDVVVAVGAPNAPVGLRGSVALARLTAAHTREGLLPINISPPLVSGTAALGQTLTATPGVWSNKPSSFMYTWQRCDAAGATCKDAGGGPTYTVTTADGGSTLRVQVTATNSVGMANAVSATTAAVAGPPVSTESPTIAGTPAVGQALTATTGTWSGNPTSFAYQWQRCDQAGAGCAAAAGANAQTYTVTASDIGSTLRVAVTATNTNGSTLAVLLAHRNRHRLAPAARQTLTGRHSPARWEAPKHGWSAAP